MLRSVLVAIVLAWLLVGCSLGGGSRDQAGQLGTLREGGSGKTFGTVSGLVVIEGGPAVVSGQSDVRPVKNAIIDVSGRSAAGGIIVCLLTANGRGRFRVVLPPGRYKLIARIFPANPDHPQRSVVVEAGQSIRVLLKGYVV